MTISQALRRTVQIKARATAVIFGERRQTWAQLADRVARLAGGLRALGLAPGARLAVLANNSDRYLELYLAAAWAGLVIVPLNTRWSEAENHVAVTDSGAALLAVDPHFSGIGQSLAATVPGLRLLAMEPGMLPGSPTCDTLVAHAEAIADTSPASTALAGIFYTGGTTGRAKGVMLSHGNLIINALHMLAEGLFAGSATYLHTAPMFHLANGGAMYATLMSGGTQVIVPGFTPEGVMAAIATHRVTETILVPTMIQMLIDHPALGDYDLTSLATIVYGAAPISEALMDRTIATLPGTKLVQAYGMTELSPVVSVLHWSEVTGPARASGRHRSAGRATFGVDVRIVDAAGNTLAPGEVGEIVVRGDTVMMGYWQQPAETARAVVDGWMHTGDGGYMDADGFITIVDRIKDMIITGGENVYSCEVENAVLAHPAVASCAVIGIPHDHWGETVHAVVVRRAGHEVTEQAVIAHCKTLIAGYKCPRSVVITDQPLPLSGAGKVLKTALRAPFWAGQARAVT